MRLQHVIEDLVCKLLLAQGQHPSCGKVSSGKILVVTFDAIGDMVLTTPVLHAIRKIFADSSMDILCSSRNYPVIRDCGYLADIYCCDLNGAVFSSHEWRTLRRLRQNNYARVINLFDEPSALALAKISCLSDRIDSLPLLHKGERQQRIAARLSERFRYSKPVAYRYFTERLFGILELWGETIPHHYKYEICLSDATRTNVGVKYGEMISGALVFNPQGSREDNTLGEAQAAEILGALLAKGQRVILFASPFTQRLLQKNRNLAAERNLVVIADDGILEVAAIIASADEVLTTDTSIAHIAVALEKPVTIMKSSSQWWRMFDPPYGDCRVLIAGGSGAVSAISVKEVLSSLKCLA